ncbi:MAG TPA: GGDEF domain-containing phosphodiesterase [Micromonosporaceae bacterium]|jgi:diguanylate cyclase (GGDEF)-like protein
MTAFRRQKGAFIGNTARGRFMAAENGHAPGGGGERLARDPGTGLLDQHGLSARLATLIDTDGTARSEPFAVVLLNVDSVLPIARNLGRQLFQKVVAAAAEILADACHPDMVGRLAGEGFVIIVPDVDETGWQAEAQRIVRLLAEPVEVATIPFDLDPAVGVALFPEHGRDFGTLVAKAEMAMTEARRLGEPFRLYRRQDLAILHRRLDLLTDLHRVLRDPRRESEINVLYQPQVDLRTGRLVGVEALLRWRHPEWGTVNTQELVEAVEQTEVMHLLTGRVIDGVTSQLGAWARQGLPIRAAVNISVNDMHHPDFVDDIDVALHKNGLRPEQLTIEITEGMLISDPGRVTRAANSLRSLGLGLSMDDFGTGYASLQQLRLLPLTEVKIDRSYVSKMAENPTQQAIVTGVHALARSLGLDVVAEGVEDATTAASLAVLADIIGQGWHFARPMSAGALVDWWRGHRDGTA